MSGIRTVDLEVQVRVRGFYMLLQVGLESTILYADPCIKNVNSPVWYKGVSNWLFLYVPCRYCILPGMYTDVCCIIECAV